MKSMKYMSGGARKYNNGGGASDDSRYKAPEGLSEMEARAFRNKKAGMRRSGNTSFTYKGKEYSTYDNEKAEAGAQKARNQTTRFGNKRDGDPGEKESRDELEKEGRYPRRGEIFYDSKGNKLSKSKKMNYGTPLYDKNGNKVGKSGKSRGGVPTYLLDSRIAGPKIPKDLQDDKGQMKPGEKGKPKAVEPSKPKSKSKTTAELWKEKTGTDWSEAKKRGLTDGSAKSNLEIRKALKAGRDFKAAPKKIEQKRDKFVSKDGKSLVDPNKPKAELQVRKPQSKIPELEPSKEVSFDSPSAMTTRKGKRLEKKAGRIAARKTRRAEAKEGREMVKAARKMKRGGRR